MRYVDCIVSVFTGDREWVFPVCIVYTESYQHLTSIAFNCHCLVLHCHQARVVSRQASARLS